jgi:hypothetical protein
MSLKLFRELDAQGVDQWLPADAGTAERETLPTGEHVMLVYNPKGQRIAWQNLDDGRILAGAEEDRVEQVLQAA